MTRAFQTVEYDIPPEDEQMLVWKEARGLDWCTRFETFARKQPRETIETARGILVWNRDRYYELAYLWNDLNLTAVQITRFWIGQKHIPLNSDIKGAADGTGHRGVVDGMARRMQRFGILEKRQSYSPERIQNAIHGRSASNSGDAPPRVARPPVSMREIMEIRRRRLDLSGGSFDSLPREERGLPSQEMANVQHPDHAPGVTYDMAFRNDHGRTHLFTATEKRRLGVFSRISDLVRGLTKLTETALPTIAEFDGLRANEKDLILHGIAKALPEAMILLNYLEELKALPETISPETDDQEPAMPWVE